MDHERDLANADKPKQHRYCRSRNSLYDVQIGRSRYPPFLQYIFPYVEILHRLIKCDSEDYLVRKFSNLVEEMGDFINFVSKTVRDKEILEGSNMDDGVKIDIENDDDEDDMSSKKERKDQIKI